jgi:hypothetical protein
MPALVASMANLPDAKISVLYENDDFGKDYLIGLREGLGARAAFSKNCTAIMVPSAVRR